ncbi:MAG: hypothetical protein K6U03_09645, partial [Firmicutes bacterium]|nr:hypothetical protein [Bacillota bacterium]
LWAEADEERAAGSLRTALYAIRRALSDRGATCEILEMQRDAVRVSPLVNCRIDAREFEAKAWAGLGKTAEIEPLMAAASLYRGEFLSEMDADWCMAERQRLAGLYRGILRALVDRLTANGLLEAACFHARQWLDTDPLDEAAHRALMRLYSLMGQPALAIEQFESCSRVLQAELGVGPGEATLHLYRELGLIGHDRHARPKENAVSTRRKRRTERMPEVEQLSPDPLREARLLLAQGEAKALEGESMEGVSILEKALTTYERFGGIAAKARQVLGEVLLWLSIPLTPLMDRVLRLKAIAHLKQAADYYRASGPPTELIRTLLLSAEANWLEGRNHESASAAREGLVLADRLGDRESEGLLATVLAMSFRERFRLAEARAAYARAVEAVPGLTNLWQILWLVMERAALSYITGDLAEAEQYLREAMALCRSVTFPTLQIKVGECMTRSMMLVILHYQDRRAEMGEFLIPPGMERYTPEPFIYLNPLFYRAKDPAVLLPGLAGWLRARLLGLPQPMLACTIRVIVEEMLVHGMYKEAARWSAVGLRLARVRDWSAIQALYYSYRAVALARLGRLGGAERCRRRAVEYVDGLDRWAPAWLARADGAIAQARGDRAEAARCFAQSIRLFKQMGAIY